MDYRSQAERSSTSHGSTRPVEKDILPASRCKSDRILEVCGDSPDIAALLSFATSPHGLMTDEVRRRACTYSAQRNPRIGRLIGSLRAHLTGIPASEHNRFHKVGKLARSTTPQG